MSSDFGVAPLASIDDEAEVLAPRRYRGFGGGTGVGGPADEKGEAKNAAVLLPTLLPVSFPLALSDILVFEFENEAVGPGEGSGEGRRESFIA